MDSVLKFLIKMQADGGNVLTVARETTTRLDEIANKARSAGARLKEAFSFSNFKSSLMSLPGMEFLTNPYTMVAGAVGAITKIGAEAEQTSVAFTTLVGNERKAKGMLDEIAKFAAESPFGKLDLTENAKTMLNFGVETGKVLPLLKQLGDISGGDKNRLQSLSLVLGQVSAAGKLQGQDNLQFINAGFNPLQELAKMTGKSYAELQQKMSDGQITFENVVQAIQHATGAGGKFFGMMQAQSQTTAGKWATLQDTFIQLAVDIYAKIEPFIKQALDLFIGIVPIISAAITKVINIIGTVIDFVARFKTEIGYLAIVIGVAAVVFNAHTIAMTAYSAVMVVVTTATRIWTGVQWLLNAALNANPIGLVIIAVAALVAGVIYCWNKFAGFRAFLLTMWDVMKGFGNIIKTFIIDRFSDMLSGLGKLGQALRQLFSGDFAGAAASASAGFKQISGVSAMGKAFQSTKQLAGAVGTSWNKHYKEESASQRAKERAGSHTSTKSSVSIPGLKGSAGEVVFGDGKADKKKKGKKGKKGGKSGRKSAEEIATGGSRSTSITMNISKFFDNINVTMMDKADTSELERVILQSMNRALAIATSTER